jgi:hypothetical protein
MKELKANNALVIKRQISTAFTWAGDMYLFCLTEIDVFHCMLSHIISGLYWQHNGL